MENLKTSFYTYTYRHRLVGIPDCAIDVLFPSTEGIESDEEDDGSSSEKQLGSVGIIVIIVIVILIVCTGTIS